MATVHIEAWLRIEYTWFLDVHPPVANPYKSTYPTSGTVS